MKTIQLSVEQAKELYQNNKELRTTLLHQFTNEELGIEIELKDWKDLNFNDTYYPTPNGNFQIYSNGNHLSVPTEKHAKSILAFAKLSMLMADLGEECNIDWENYNTNKYCITLIYNKIESQTYVGKYNFLAFKTGKVRGNFLKKHERLIKDYFMLD